MISLDLLVICGLSSVHCVLFTVQRPTINESSGHSLPSVLL